MYSRKSFPIIGLAFLILLVVGCDVPANTPTVADTCTSVLPTSTLLATSIPSETVKPVSSPKKMLLLYDDDGSRDGMAALL